MKEMIRDSKTNKNITEKKTSDSNDVAIVEKEHGN